MGQRIHPSDELHPYFQEGTLYTFKIGGQAERPELIENPRARVTGPELDFEVNELFAERGRGLYINNCIRCHGPIDGKAGAIPDLAASPQAIHDIWQNIVHDGVFASAKGMPMFEGDLSRDEIKFIQHFVVRESRAVAENQ